MILVEGGEDWQTYMKQTESTKMHLINPVNLRLNLYKCLITDDYRLPLFKITGELPSVNIIVTDIRVLMLVDLFLSVPFPSSEEELPALKPLEESKSISSSTTLLKYLESHEKNMEKVKKDKSSQQLQQHTLTDIKFVMSGKLEITKEEE